MSYMHRKTDIHQEATCGNFKAGNKVRYLNGTAHYRVVRMKDQNVFGLSILDGTGILYPMPDSPDKRLVLLKGETEINTTLEEGDMKQVIIDNFSNTKDAVLVEKYLGSEIKEGFVAGLVVKQFSKEILAEAKRREKEEKEEKAAR